MWVTNYIEIVTIGTGGWLCWGLTAPSEVALPGQPPLLYCSVKQALICHFWSCSRHSLQNVKLYCPVSTNSAIFMNDTDLLAISFIRNHLWHHNYDWWQGVISYYPTWDVWVDLVRVDFELERRPQLDNLETLHREVTGNISGTFCIM